jgi:hypothetical protein
MYRNLLPTTVDNSGCSNAILGKCFLAGDSRVNEQPGSYTCLSLGSKHFLRR